MEQGDLKEDASLTTWRVGVETCVSLSAQVSQRPTVGGEDSIDKNKQRMTIPPRIVATNITRPASCCSLMQFGFRKWQKPNHLGYGTFALCGWISLLEEPG